jgi:hypothetical protein
MNRYTTRGIAIGFIIVSVFLYFYISKSVEPSIDASIQSVKEAGYSIYLKKDDPHAKVAFLQEKYDKLKAEKIVSQTPSKNEGKEGYQTYFISVEHGMTSKDISSRLNRAGFLKNEQSLDNYLIKKNWANQIQIGEYKITSNMNLDEIARMITNHD